MNLDFEFLKNHKLYKKCTKGKGLRYTRWFLVFKNIETGEIIEKDWVPGYEVKSVKLIRKMFLSGISDKIIIDTIKSIKHSYKTGYLDGYEDGGIG